MLVLTDSETEIIDFDDKYGLMSKFQDIALNSGTQETLSANLTLLRNAALKLGKKEQFDAVFETMRKVIGDDYDFQQSGLTLRFKYSLEDFTNSEEPYHEVFMQPSKFLQTRAMQSMAAEAKKAGFNGFKKTYDAYVDTLRCVSGKGGGAISTTDFPDQPIELDCGEWHCDYSGVRMISNGYEDVACLHPIMPTERLVNIDTGEEKLKIAYYKGRYWREIIVSKYDLFDASKVIKLSAVGVSVTSKSARLLSDYLCTIEALNYDLLPEHESVSRLGFIGDGHSFSPYVDGLIFDGDANYSTIYNAITQKGSFDEWLKTALICRNDSITAQIMLAAAFASVLINKIGGLCFFVHLWGVESGTGKTVALMLAASVWGNPAVGQYVQTFNATQVGHERVAAFLNNIPMCIDELQLSKDSHGKSKFDVYQLSQGVGRGRGTKTGGIDNTPTWSLCILTTGESPLTSDNSGAGAVNRVIDIECRAKDAVVRDGLGVTRSIKQNYGHAGKMFVEALTDEVISGAKDTYEKLFKELSSGSTTEKQAMAAAILLTADELADRFIFKTGKHLTVEQISDFLKSKASVSAGERGYSYMCDWVAMNSNKFKSSNESSDVYGVIQDDWAYINGAVFRKAAKDAGFDDRALLSWLKTNSLILTRGRRFTRGKRINNINVECVVMKLPSGDEEPENIEDFEDLL